MSRDLTSSVKTAALAAVKNIAVLMEADFDSGFINLFSGYGTMTIGDRTYIGSGDLIQVDPAQETTEIQATNATIQLSGVQASDIAISLGENYQGRPCRLKLAFFDSSNNLIDDPVTMFAGRMDVMTVNDDPTNPTITMTAENELIRMTVARHRNRTNEDQQIDYPGDKGLEFVAAMQNKTIFV
jgi:hypothetical protein